ncbi:MAG: hypothetical protein QMD01_08005 [Thermodesulfovibrionales bacterium]|nr:hypothetical protein [Thermodesulfovibrionales bacterium]
MDIPLLFCRLLVSQGRISDEDLDHALKVQNEVNLPMSVVAVENGFTGMEEFKKILTLQRDKAMTFEEAALQLNILNNDTIDAIRKKKKGRKYPYRRNPY